MSYFMIFLISVFISSVSQILLKTSANVEHGNKVKEYLNLKVIAAYGIFFLASLLTVWAYKGVPLSMGPILEASGYIWVAVLGRFILGEKIKVKKGIGLMIIVLGIIVSNL